MLTDDRVRTTAFEWLSNQVALHGDILTRHLLLRGFMIEGVRIPLLSPQGIFKPAVLPEIPLTIVTSPNSPDNDNFRPDGLLQYRYRGTDRDHPDNVGLRKAMTCRVPLIYFRGVSPGKYDAAWLRCDWLYPTRIIFLPEGAW
jgi:putative restriction endonuclease